LSSLTGLTELHAGGNRLSDIRPLAALVELRVLYLWTNQIEDLAPLAGLTNLSRLSLRSNYFSDISPLLENEGLGEGDFLNVKSVTLSQTSIDEHIPELQRRGVEVWWGFDPNDPPTPTPTLSPTPSPISTRPEPSLTQPPISTPAQGLDTPVPTSSAAPDAGPDSDTSFNVWMAIGPALGGLVVMGLVLWLAGRRRRTGR